MTRLHLIAATAAVALAGHAEARPVPPHAVPATYDAATRRFCVTPQALEAVGATARLGRSECRSRGIWRSRGIRFDEPPTDRATPR